MASNQHLEDPNRGPTIVVISWLFLSFAFIIVFLRLATRLKKKAHGWDDYLIYAALVGLFLILYL